MELCVLPGLCLEVTLMLISDEALLANLNRLTNQFWKLIPMRENGENWKDHLSSVILELAGLTELINSKELLILLSKLKGL